MYFHGRRGEGTTILERIAISFAGVSQSSVTALVEWGGSMIEDFVFLVGVQADNRRLMEENERLLGEAMTAKRLVIENRSLRRLVGLKENLKRLETVPARVVGKELTPYYRVSRMSLEIGEDHEVEMDMAVVTHEGLVGRVVRIAAGYADVMLLPDSRSRVACEVLGRGILGMVIGEGELDGYKARLQLSVTEKPLDEGAIIQTSGHDRVFPRGIEVGYVADPSGRRQVGPFTEYDVVLAVNPTSVEHAMVVGIRGPDKD